MELCNKIIKCLSSAHKDAVISSQFISNSLKCEHHDVLESIKDLQKIDEFIFVQDERSEDLESESLIVRRGRKFDPDLKVTDEMNYEILEDWTKYFFLPYNFDTNATPLLGGKLNYVIELFNSSRHALFELGFREILCHNGYVNEKKEKLHFLNMQNEEKVLIRMIEHVRTPDKVFSVGKVFKTIKDEEIDLNEFHDVQMILADKDVYLSDLLGIIETFFEKVKVEKVDFKPGYSRLTEPTLDLSVYHPEMDKWLTVGSAGIVRPEFNKTDGTLLHWKFSIEIIALIKLEIVDIKKLLESTL